MSNPSDPGYTPETRRLDQGDEARMADTTGQTNVDEPAEPAADTRVLESDPDITRPAGPIPAVDRTLALDPEPLPPVSTEDSPSRDRPALRMRTVVLGFLLMVVAVLVLIGQLTDVSIDLGAVALAVMICCGLLLVAGARRT